MRADAYTIAKREWEKTSMQAPCPQGGAHELERSIRIVDMREVIYHTCKKCKRVFEPRYRRR